MAVFRKTDHEYPVFAHPALVLKRDFEKNKKLQDDRLCELTNREVQSSFVLDFLLREHVSDCVIIFLLLDRAEPLFLRTLGWDFRL